MRAPPVGAMDTTALPQMALTHLARAVTLLAAAAADCVTARLAP